MNKRTLMLVIGVMETMLKSQYNALKYRAVTYAAVAPLNLDDHIVATSMGKVIIKS